MSLILVVEDEPDVLGLVRLVLKLERHEVLEASTGRLGLEILERDRPDALVLDIGLPDMDGWTVLERLRATRAREPIPVIVLSARTNEGDVERALDHGCRAVLTKPFDPRELIRKLDEMLDGAGERSTAGRH